MGKRPRPGVARNVVLGVFGMGLEGTAAADWTPCATCVSVQVISCRGRRGPTPGPIQVRRSSFPALSNYPCPVLPCGLRDSREASPHALENRQNCNPFHASGSSSSDAEASKRALAFRTFATLPRIGARLGSGSLSHVRGSGPFPIEAHIRRAKPQWCCFTSPRTGDSGRLAGAARDARWNVWILQEQGRDAKGPSTHIDCAPQNTRSLHVV